MAINPLGLAPHLQAWHSAGLSFLYLPQVDAFALAARPARAVEAGPERPRGASVGTFAEKRPGVQAEAKNTAQARVGASGQAAAMPRAAGPSPAAPAPGGPGSTSPTGTARPIAKAAGAGAAKAPLPQVWQAASLKVKNAPVIWSYAELGEDLLGQASPERRAALQKLIKELGLSAGTSAFLPVSLPGRPQDGGDAEYFAQILARAGGKVLVFLGGEALALSPYADLQLGLFEEKIADGRLILCLPGFAELLASADLFGATQSFLRMAFVKIKVL